MGSMITPWIAALALAAVPPARADDGLTLVESFPLETELDNADIPETLAVWMEMIASARESLDLAHFYASSAPGSPLNDVLAALEAAAQRGVRVRFLVSERFYATYPEIPDRLAAHPAIELRRVDYRALAGGVMHAKYMIADGARTFLGSPNFDYRSLEHVQELGVLVESAAVARELGAVFEMDWRMAQSGERTAPAAAGASGPFPVELAFAKAQAGGADAKTKVTPVFSPRELLPDPALWDLPRLVEWIDAAQETVAVQLLTYRTVGYDGRYFAALESALRDAAARGVEVRLLVSDWCKAEGTVEGLQSLQCLPGIEVRFVTIPEWSGGFQPFARVVHAKYMVVDSARAWIGTSNWEESYFTKGRNVGLLLEGAALAGRLARFFERTWTSAYAYDVDPCAEYVPPKRQ